MKDIWYADKRDLVKWATLAHLARRDSLQLIVQVPFRRSSELPVLQTGNGEIAIRREVWDFFRNVKAVEALGPRIRRRIVVLDRKFVPQQRKKYRQSVVKAVREFAEPKVVLLDPDIGIEPEKATPEHATVEDVKAVWNVLNARDWLVLYQHKWRQKDWCEKARSRFSAACEDPPVEGFRSRAAPDVVFIAARKIRTGGGDG